MSRLPDLMGKEMLHIYHELITKCEVHIRTQNTITGVRFGRKVITLCFGWCYVVHYSLTIKYLRNFSLLEA